MADPAHEETEKIIKIIESRLKKEYQQAVAEVQDKLDDYLARFAVKDKTWREWVAKAADPQEKRQRQKEYDEWRVGQIAIGKRWEDLRDTLAEDYHNANEIARSITTGYMPEVYAINHNYGTFEIEKGSGLDTSYTLYDRQTVERLLRDNPKLLPDPGKDITRKIYAGLDVKWNRQQIQSVMLQSILQGESIPQIAARLAETVGDRNYKAAIRNARTMATGAQNAGRVDSYKRAQDMGINVQQQWLATLDNRTRHTHRAVDHETQPVGEKFSNGCRFPGDPEAPGREIYNCFTGDVKVAADSKIIRSYKHKYNGVLVTIETSRGVKFTCTPNHPILTAGGWIGADCLHEGDNILIARIGDKHLVRCNPNVKHIFTSFEAIHKLFNIIGGERACVLGVDFHGDIAASNVEIITQKRLLGHNGDSGFFEGINKFLLKFSNKSFSSNCTFVKHLRRIWKTTLCNIGGKGKSFSFLNGSLSHPTIHCLGTAADSNPGVSKDSINDLTAASVICGESFDRFGTVFLDNIISIDRKTCSTHVYNLQTEKGYYYVNTSIPKDCKKVNDKYVAIAHNCRCTLRGIVEGLEPQAVKYRDLSDVGGSYEEWKNSKEKPDSNPIDLPIKKAEAIKRSYIKEYQRKSLS